MHTIKTISIGNFRRLHKVDIEMRQLMVMIGANGVGKTTMLDGISLLSASAASGMNKALSDMGGIADVITRNDPGPLTMGAEMSVEGHEPLKYQLEIEPKGASYAISQESLSQSRAAKPEPFKYIESKYDSVHYFNTETGKLVRPEWEHNPLESSLSQVPKMYRQPEELRKVLTSVNQYHVLDVSKRAPVKLPQQMTPALFPGNNGEDLVPFLYYLRENDPDRYEIIEDTLKTAFPDFQNLSFPPVAAGMLAMTWKDRNFRTPLSMHQLSEGTLRFIWLVSLLQSPSLSTITMIDEPEVSLHPELLNLFAQLLREASMRTQIVVATHSDRFIRFLKPNELVVIDVDEEGHSSPTWADSLDLDRWLADYCLDDVWRMGHIEGAHT